VLFGHDHKNMRLEKCQSGLTDWHYTFAVPFLLRFC